MSFSSDSKATPKGSSSSLRSSVPSKSPNALPTAPRLASLLLCLYNLLDWAGLYILRELTVARCRHQKKKNWTRSAASITASRHKLEEVKANWSTLKQMSRFSIYEIRDSQ